jgi:hypothetical protein
MQKRIFEMQNIIKHKTVSRAVFTLLREKLSYPKLVSQSENTVKARIEIIKQFGLASIVLFKLKEKYRLLRKLPGAVHLPFLFPRERYVILALIMLAVLLSTFASQASSNVLSSTNADLIAGSRPQSKNWLNGKVDFSASPKSLVAATKYASSAEYTHVTSDLEKDRLVAHGQLEKLAGRYNDFSGNTELYAHPAVATFANRLGFLYANHGCGKLEISRGLEQLPAESSGADAVLRSTGMVISFTRSETTPREDTFCVGWLKETLGEIEASRRIDVTESSNGFDVIVAIEEYQKWLKKQLSLAVLESNVLAEAVFFEAPFKASPEELQAIAWVIKNRAASEDYPDSVVEVVAEGSAGRSAGSCQFSFRCDGKPEATQLLCGNRTDDFWQSLCQNRYKKILEVVTKVMNEKVDPTKGAVLYYAVWLKETGKAPKWATTDMIKAKKIGEHFVGCSRHRGRKMCGG